MELATEPAARASWNTFFRRLRVDFAFDLKRVGWVSFVGCDSYRLLEWAKAVDIVTYLDIGRFAREDWVFRIAWNRAAAATFGVADDKRLVACVREFEVANSFWVTLFALHDITVVDFGCFEFHLWLCVRSSGKECQECEN